MKILGISCYYHDASAALIVDGKVVAASAEERFTRRKHDPSFPIHAIQFCLKEGGLKGEDLDLVVFHEDPVTKLTRTLATSFARFPFSLGTFLKSAGEAVSGAFWVRRDISKHVGVRPRKIVFTPHHMSHAAHAFLTSSFEEAAVMTVDAVGEWTSSALFKASRKNGKVAIEPLDVAPFPSSLGLVYSAFTAYLGFKVNDGECSVMALAAFGKPGYVEQVRKIVRVMPDGRYDVDISWFDFRDDTTIPVTEKFIKAFGSPRPYKEKILFDSLKGAATVDSESQRFADIAASVQVVFQEAVNAYADRAKALTGMRNLCYAGGGALNCVANSSLMDQKKFASIYIPPDPGDGGGAVGAALYADSVYSKSPGTRSIHPYLGKDIDPEQFAVLVPHLKTETWHRFSLLRPTALKTQDLKFHEFKSDADLVKWTAERIQSGRTVGWCQGRAENGPRALGNRSILIRPDDVGLAKRLSERVKLRASFRPYAAALTAREADQSLDMRNSGRDLSAWMQSSYAIREEAKGALRAATHVDGTTRAQCVRKEENPLFHDLLVEVGRLSGREAVLNTSLNESGFPLVNDSVDAIMMFARTELEVLVVGRYALEKPAFAEVR